MSKEDKQAKSGYQGPGKFISTIGGVAIGGFFGNIAAKIIGMATGGLAYAQAYKASMSGGDKPAGAGTAIAGLIAMAVVSLGSIIYGGVKGYKKAKRGQEQYAQNEAELANARSEVGIEQQKHQITKQEMELLEKRMSQGKSQGHAAAEQERAASASALQVG